MIEIKKVDSVSLRRKFVRFPYTLYKREKFWVPMFLKDSRRLAKNKGSLLFENGPHELYLAFKDGKVAGRVCVGIEEVLNKRKGYKHAYFTLFESINDKQVADALIHKCLEWAKKHGMKYLKGPISPTNGDDYRGILAEGFDKPPAILMPFNHEYYTDLFRDFDVYLRYLAYESDLEGAIPQKSRLMMTKIAQRYSNHSTEEIREMDETRLGDIVCEEIFEKRGFSAETVLLKTKKQVERATDDLHTIMKDSYPDIWEEDLVPPTRKEVHEMITDLKLVIDSGMAIIARKEGEPIGIILAIPDINEGIKKSKGKLFPFGWYHILKHKKDTQLARGVILFVVKKYQRQGIPGFLMLKLRKNLKKLAYKKMELSSISEMNDTMNGVYQWLDLKVTKNYIVYGKSVSGKKLGLDEIYGNAAQKVGKFEESQRAKIKAVS